GRISVVPISAGGRREVVKRHADGQSESVLQTVPARIEALAAAIDAELHTRMAELEAGRDRALLHLAHTELETTLEDYRRRRADEVIGQYTRKAVLGAMVAVSPGTDILVQGYLSVELVRALCRLYEVPVRDLDVTHLLKAANSSVRKSLPVVLAVAGNAFKAFPGLGTLAGGCLHAVGYGLLFEGLGRAVARCLSEHRQLSVFPVLRHFKESINDDLEARAKRLAELALAEEKQLNQRR
ncbi:MAG: GTPase, partial [Gammaproteobacteria bacterium]